MTIRCRYIKIQLVESERRLKIEDPEEQNGLRGSDSLVRSINAVAYNPCRAAEGLSPAPVNSA